MSSAEEELPEHCTVQKTEVPTGTNDILLPKLNHSNVFDEQITNNDEKVESELNCLNVDGINNEEKNVIVAADIVIDDGNMFRNSSDFPVIELNTKKLESPVKSGLSNSVQSAFETTNELDDQTKQYTDSSFFFTSESFMNFLTDVNSMDSTNVESSQLHVHNLNSELNSILDSHIQVPEKLPHSNLTQSSVQLAQPLISFTNESEMKSFQKIYQPQESYFNLSKNEIKLSSMQTLPDYSSSMDFNNLLLKDNFSLPKDPVSSNSWVDESGKFLNSTLYYYSM